LLAEALEARQKDYNEKPPGPLEEALAYGGFESLSHQPRASALKGTINHQSNSTFYSRLYTFLALPLRGKTLNHLTHGLLILRCLVHSTKL